MAALLSKKLGVTRQALSWKFRALKRTYLLRERAFCLEPQVYTSIVYVGDWGGEGVFP